MWNIIASIVPIILGIVGLVEGMRVRDIYILLIGGLLVLVGVLLYLTMILVSYIIKADDRNITALNEIIKGMSD